MRLPRDPRPSQPPAADRRRFVILVAAVAALLGVAALQAPNARSQTPTPTPAPAATTAPVALPVTGAAPAPFPTTAPGQIGTSVPPQNIFYVSPVGCDPGTTGCAALPASPTLPCAAVGPCATMDFALSQARDGDIISMAGGEYDIVHPIEVNKLVTIAPNGFGSASTTAQTATTATMSCTTALCTATLGIPLLATSTVIAQVTAPSNSDVTVTFAAGSPLTPPGSTIGCPLQPPQTFPVFITAGATAVLTFLCLPGQSFPATQNFLLAVAATANPTASLSVTAPSTSLRPVVKSCAGIIPATTTAPASCAGPGSSAFHVTAVGSAALHTTIFGLTIGNASSTAGQAAIILDNDAYTEIAKNVIGSQDLPNAIGILLTASNHPIIHDNTIQGSTLFPRTATLLAGSPPAGGFGVVTEECFGAVNHSNGVQLVNNLFAKNSNAGLWFCSDGTGGFLVNANTITANGRGIVFSDAVDTFVSGNIISDNVLDGIDLQQTSQRNQITNNVIESQQSPESVGILLAGTGLFFPIGNQIVQNQIHRNTIGVAIVGAQGTRFVNNSITATGTNTGVLFSLAMPGWSSGQPLSTTFSANALQAGGGCFATSGCTIRLTAGVIVNIDASAANDWGVSDFPAIQLEIWDHGRDPSLGVVYVQAALPPQLTVPGILGAPGTQAPPTLAGPTGTPSPPRLITTPAPTSTPAPAVSTPVPVQTPSPGGTSAPATGQTRGAFDYLDPDSNTYYVPVALCLTDASGNPEASSLLTLAYSAADGSSLGTSTVTTGPDGCFNGNVQPDGDGRFSQPSLIVITDQTGATSTYTISPGTPPVQPPNGPIQ